MPDVTSTTNLVYTPPSAAQNSGVASLTATATYEAQSVGVLDIPTGFTPGPVDIPFGTIQGAQLMMVKNLTNNSIGVRFNGAVADEFQLASGATISLHGPTVPSAPITSMAISILTAPATVTEYIQFWVFGI